LNSFPRPNSPDWSEYLHHLLSYLTGLVPSQVDLQFRSLYDPVDDTDEMKKTPMRRFLSCLAKMLNQNENFEVIQAFLYRIIFIHGITILEDRYFSHEINVLQRTLKVQGIQMQNLMQATLCLVRNSLNISSS
jgi:hypothetical protein